MQQPPQDQPDLYGQPLPYAPPLPPETGGQGQAIASLVLGILGLFGWCLPCIGLPMGVIGLVLGIRGLNTRGRTMAKVGIVLCIIGLVLALINAAIGAYMGATGQHPLLNAIRRDLS